MAEINGHGKKSKNNIEEMKRLHKMGLFINDIKGHIIKQEAGNAKHHSQCLSGFVNIKYSVQDVLFVYTLILP